MNRIDRISAILVQLQSKRIVKAQDIAERFGISLRTVYRDINTLNEAGVPIIGEAGVGYSLTEGYRLPPVMFTSEEALAFLTAEKLVEKLTDKNTFSSYQSALFKIKAILKTTEKDNIENLTEHIEVIENPHLPKRFENNQYIQDILKSISSKEAISIHYFANYSQEATERNIEPMGIFFSSGNWHLIAYCLLRNDYRQFRIDRINGIKFKNQPFQKKHPALKTYLSQLTKKEQELHTIVIRIINSSLRYLGEQKYYLGYVSEKPVKNNMTEMTFLTASIEGFARWFMMFGDHAEIVSPPILKERIKTIAEGLLKNIK